VTPRFLDVEEVLAIHRYQIERYGGSLGVRDLGLLQSAVAMPQAGAGDEYFHEDIFEMAAAYLFHIVRNHPFIDGNKRTGTAAALVFLDLNKVSLDPDLAEFEQLVRSVAEGKRRKTPSRFSFAVAFENLSVWRASPLPSGSGSATS
jgi:death-on-curing protein